MPGRPIDIKFGPPYKDKVENEFLKTQEFRTLFWGRYVGGIFLCGLIYGRF